MPGLRLHVCSWAAQSKQHLRDGRSGWSSDMMDKTLFDWSHVCCGIDQRYGALQCPSNACFLNVWIHVLINSVVSRGPQGPMMVYIETIKPNNGMNVTKPSTQKDVLDKTTKIKKRISNQNVFLTLKLTPKSAPPGRRTSKRDLTSPPNNSSSVWSFDTPIGSHVDGSTGNTHRPCCSINSAY